VCLVLLSALIGRYFEGGVSSVYFWDLDHGFAGVILIKKAGDGSNKIKGCWDSIHVVEVQVCSLCLLHVPLWHSCIVHYRDQRNNGRPSLFLKTKFLWPWPWRSRPWPWRSRPWPWELYWESFGINFKLRAPSTTAKVKFKVITLND